MVERLNDLLLIVGMVMAVDLLEGLDTHAEKSSRFPHRYASLGDPRRTGVTKGMWHHLWAESRGCSNRSEALIDPLHRSAVPLDHGLR